MRPRTLTDPLYPAQKRTSLCSRPTRYDCGVVTNMEFSGFQANSNLLEFVIDGRAYYVVTESEPPAFGGMATMVTASLAAGTRVRVGWAPNASGDPVVHFIDAPAGTCKAATGKRH